MRHGKLQGLVMTYSSVAEVRRSGETMNSWWEGTIKNLSWKVANRTNITHAFLLLLDFVTPEPFHLFLKWRVFVVRCKKMGCLLQSTRNCPGSITCLPMDLLALSFRKIPPKSILLLCACAVLILCESALFCPVWRWVLQEFYCSKNNIL